MRIFLTVTILVFACALSTSPAAADKIDDIVASGHLRCGAMLDFPPAGFRDSQNEPDGYDVQVCKDMAKALGVQPVIVETNSSQRVPSLLTNKIDVLVASTSNTLERAKTVAFSSPYVVYVDVVLARKDSGFKTMDELKGRHVGGVIGTTTETTMMANLKRWGEGTDKYTGYGTEIDSYLALSQGKVDGLVVTNTVGSVLSKSQEFSNLVVVGTLPSSTDPCAIAVNKKEGELLRWINLFISKQAQSGRYAELYKKYFNLGEPPVLSADGSF